MKNIGKVWLVIEGDNGTGKDTLADQLVSSGFVLLNTHPLARAAEQKARDANGAERITKFLEYNKVCSELVQYTQSSTIQVRYWPSTLAAAYADKILTWKEIQNEAKRLSTVIGQPEMIIYLECNLNERVRRLAKRGSIPNRVDDITAERAARHRVAMREFSNLLGQRRWFSLECTTMKSTEVCTKALDILDNLKMTYEYR